MLRVLVVATIFLLCSCSATKFTSEPIERPSLDLTNPEPLQMRDVKIIIITPENAKKVFGELEKQGLSPVLFGLTGPGYTNLSLNIDDIKNYIILQRKIIILYKEYYEGNDDRKENKKKNKN